MLYVEIATVLVLIVVNGVLSMSELAVVSSRPARLKAMIERGVKGSRRALALTSDPGRFLSSVQIGITLVGVISGAFSGATLAVRLSTTLIEFGMPERFAEPLSYGLVVTAITYLSLIAGELVPKQLALRNPEAVACKVAPAMTLLARVASPLVSALDLSGRGLLRLLGGRSEPTNRVTEEEIKTLVAEAETAGVLEPEERAMIGRVLRLGDRPVRAVMTPRHDVDYVDLAAGEDEIKRRITDSLHSRLPVCEGSLDNLIGIIQAKILLNAYLTGDAVDVRAFVAEAPLIPDTMDALEVVNLLRTSPVHIGLVYDEYGHFEGVVTSADILEAIVGEFHTEDGPAEPYATRRMDGSYLIDGAMPADEMAELLSVPLPADRDYHTLAGLMLAEFGRLPQVGETVDAFGVRFEVVDLDGRRIDKVLATRLPPARRLAR